MIVSTPAAAAGICLSGETKTRAATLRKARPPFSGAGQWALDKYSDTGNFYEGAYMTVTLMVSPAAGLSLLHHARVADRGHVVDDDVLPSPIPGQGLRPVARQIARQTGIVVVECAGIEPAGQTAKTDPAHQAHTPRGVSAVRVTSTGCTPDTPGLGPPLRLVPGNGGPSLLMVHLSFVGLPSLPGWGERSCAVREAATVLAGPRS